MTNTTAFQLIPVGDKWVNVAVKRVYSPSRGVWESAWYEDPCWTRDGKLRKVELVNGKPYRPTNWAIERAEKAIKSGADWYEAAGVKRQGATSSSQA